MIRRDRGIVASVIALAAGAAAPGGASAQGYYSPEVTAGRERLLVPAERRPPRAGRPRPRPRRELAARTGATSRRALADEGYCVFALTYGRKTDNPEPFDQPGGLDLRWRRARSELARLRGPACSPRPAPRKVDIVGHSEGSLMPNYYVKFLPQAHHGTARKVDDYVGMTPLWDGTNLAEAGTLHERAAAARTPSTAHG